MLEHDLTIQTQHYQQENWVGLRGLKLPSIQHNPWALLGPWVTGSQTSSRQKFSFNLLLLGKRDLVFVTFSENWFIIGVKLKLDSSHCQADQSFAVIYCIPNIKGHGHDSQNTDFSALRGRVTDCIQFHVLKRSIPFYVTSQKRLLSRFIFLLSYKNLPFVIPCPTQRKNGWRLTFLLVLAALLSILLCVPLLSHPHLPSLAPAILMTPRQEAELAWETWVIFPLSLSVCPLCHSFSLTLKLGKIHNGIEWPEYKSFLSPIFCNGVHIYCKVPPPNSPWASCCLCRSSVSNESLKGIYRARGRLKHVWAF